ncbi:MAG TPA: 2Fe-2S iron-sulfur cluster-binding protein [Bacteroidota bacterium]|nr:2Fe-2S iron-sulfur cluster-binding protein [Bacteroidota bacterium]
MSDSKKQAKVIFAPLGRSKEIRAGATIIAAANQADVPIGQSCNGDGVCGWCRVRVLQGMHHLLPPTPLEVKLMNACGFAENERAACLAKVTGEVTVTTSYW